MDYGINILVVEDLLSSRVFLKRTLKKLGFNNVVAVSDGQAALDEYKINEYDLVISDWIMPGMDGLALYQALAKGEFLKKIPFIMISVEKNREKVCQAVKSGVDHYLLKPVHPEELRTKIQEVYGTMYQ